MKRHGIFISDIHIGDMDMDTLKYEMENAFYPFLATHDIDFVIFGGDYFGRKLYMNDKNASFCTELLNEVHQLLKPDAKIRMIYGTRSHDEEQYEIFRYFEDLRDFKLISHVSVEDLYPDMKVLYLPEEILSDPSSYYKEFFKDQSYDLIAGHGIIKEVMKHAASSVLDKKNVKRRVPVFNAGDLASISNGITLFGHYHINEKITDSIFYSGSFSRWKFGEEKDKGFYYLTYDSSKKKPWEMQFIVNDYAEKYVTIGFGYQDTIYDSIDELKKKMDHFQDLVDTKAFDHLRLEFNIPEDCENAEYYIEYLKERFKHSININVNIINGYAAKKRELAKKEVEEDYEKYAPLFDPNTKIEDQVSYFIDVEYHKIISAEEVSNYIYNNLQDILVSDDE